MTKFSELEDRIAAIEKALYLHNIMNDPSVVISTQYPRVEKELEITLYPIAFEDDTE